MCVVRVSYKLRFLRYPVEIFLDIIILPWCITQIHVDYIFPLPDIDKLTRKDTTLLTLLPDKLQSRLGGCLVDFNDLEIHTELGKGTHKFISTSNHHHHQSNQKRCVLNSCAGNPHPPKIKQTKQNKKQKNKTKQTNTFYLQDVSQLIIL